MEIIAFASGKGGTGKTLMASCLGYALIQAGQRVLMIDGDPATDGLSLFLLGPKGTRQIQSFEPLNTFTGVLHAFQHGGPFVCEPRRINRAGPEDHGISYEALISGRGLYGDDSILSQALAVPDLDQKTFRNAVAELFAFLKSTARYDYVLVDTRGGFAFESTDVCALADSLVVITEPDFTSFYQDRNLIRRISAASQDLGSKTLLRSVIVNKATETEQKTDAIDLRKMESSFRLELTKEFPLRFEDTHAIPVDVEALKAYKTQRIPYRVAPASLFSFATLSAFSDILQVVTAPWKEDQINGWNTLVTSVSEAINTRNKQVIAETERQRQRDTESTELRRENHSLQELVEQLKREIARTERSYERELSRLPAMQATKRDMEVSEVAEKMRQSSPVAISRRLLPIVIVVMFVLFGAIYFGNKLLRLNEQSRVEDLVTKAYNTSLPVAIRTTYLSELVSSYHRTNFDDIDLRNATLDNMDLRAVSFQRADFSGASLTGAVLTSAKLAKAKFAAADLSGAKLRNVRAAGTTFAHANMAGADLQSSDLRGANFDGADLRGTDLSGADVDKGQLSLATVDRRTIFPDTARPENVLK